MVIVYAEQSLMPNLSFAEAGTTKDVNVEPAPAKAGGRGVPRPWGDVVAHGSGFPLSRE
jgi:hypothetical protein